VTKRKFHEFSSLASLQQAFFGNGSGRLLLKKLARNDNSKNQVYLGSNFQSLNIIPNKGVTTDTGTEGSKRNRFKALVDLWWLDGTGALCPAPNAQLILYPKYPEVRMSGFLAGTEFAPSEMMTSRKHGRLLFFGIRNDGRIIGHVTSPENPIRNEIKNLKGCSEDGVFIEIPSGGAGDETDTRTALISMLKSIHGAGWIDSVRLDTHGATLPCRSSNCGGYTLEAQLGITPNGYAEPDYLGWEVKQHGVKKLDKPHSGGPITLMTPEPTAGLYKENGIEYFVREFGYPDRMGRPDRLNFGGVHKSGQRTDITGLTMILDGYDQEKGKIEDSAGGIKLVDDIGREAATWLFADMMTHWNRKHAKAVYIPSLSRKNPQQYHYGGTVDLGEGTDFLRFLQAMASGMVYYDPGIKLENASQPKVKIKRRSQFRVKPANLHCLYHTMSEVNITE
jgi:hypothetical protein